MILYSLGYWVGIYFEIMDEVMAQWEDWVHDLG